MTGNRSCRPHWPAQSSEKPRPACLQRRSRKTGTSGCSHYSRRCPALLHVRSRAIKIPRKRIPACPRSLSTRRTFYGTSTVRRAAGIDSQIYMPVALGRVEPRCVLLLFGRWAGGGSLTIGWVRTPRVQRWNVVRRYLYRM